MQIPARTPKLERVTLKYHRNAYQRIVRKLRSISTDYWAHDDLVWGDHLSEVDVLTVISTKDGAGWSRTVAFGASAVALIIGEIQREALSKYIMREVEPFIGQTDLLLLRDRIHEVLANALAPWGLGVEHLVSDSVPFRD